MASNIGFVQPALILYCMSALVQPVKIPCPDGTAYDRLKGCISCSALCIPYSCTVTHLSQVNVIGNVVQVGD